MRQNAPAAPATRLVTAAPGWLAVAWLATACLIACGRQERWNVVLVTFDTTRADHLGCYGNDKIRTPHLDRLAAEGVRFADAISAVPVTAPSHTTILTGKYPLAHGVRDNGLFVLGERQTTLAERLKAEGYATAAAVGSFPLSARFGLDQGFDLYDDRFSVRYESFGRRRSPRAGLYFDERRAELVNEAVWPWLEQHHQVVGTLPARRQPFFLWLHYFDPHQPFEPPPPYGELYLTDPYLGEIAYADEAFGAVIKRLERLGVGDRTLVVFTADHGEGRGEHNELTHSTLAYNSTLHVPLILRIPGGPRGLTVAQRVGTVDIVPTVLDLLGLAAGSDVQGRSLVPLIEAGGGRVEGFPRTLYAETLASRLSHGLGELRVIFDRRYKYIFGPRPELFDLAQDPRERHNLAAAEGRIAAALEGKLAALVADNAEENPEAAVEIDAETRARLEALGYIQTGAAGELAVEEILDGSGTAPQERVADVNEVSTAKALLYANRPLPAKETALALVARDPGNAYYHQLLAQAEIALGQVEDAATTLETIAELGAGGLRGEQPLLLLVRHLALNGRPERALELLAGRQEAQPTAVGQWYLATVYGRLARPAEELVALRKALELEPGFAPARVDLGIHHARYGAFEAAEEEFRRALADRPYYSRAHYNYATMLLESGDPETAAGHLARAVDLQPAYLKARRSLIAVDLELGRLEAARAGLGALVALAPESPEAQAARGLFAEEVP